MQLTLVQPPHKTNVTEHTLSATFWEEKGLHHKALTQTTGGITVHSQSH